MAKGDETCDRGAERDLKRAGEAATTVVGAFASEPMELDRPKHS
jgi:hypothetical protein